MATVLDQKSRSMEIGTALGDNVLAFREMHYRERLGQLFELNVTVVTELLEVEPNDLLGTNASIRISGFSREGNRFFNGYITQVRDAGFEGRLHVYELELRPWLWFLTQTSDCRIFQEKSVPTIITDIFKEHGYQFDQRLTRTYRTWEYCVQYRETDFNFVSRLMEQEGIYYYFTHTNGEHRVVLADDMASHSPAPKYENVRFWPPGNTSEREEDHLYAWQRNSAFQPASVVLNAFDFKQPRKNLLSSATASARHERDSFEVFDYEDEFKETTDGQFYATTRLQEQRVGTNTIVGEGNAAGLFAGCTFTLSDHPLPSLDKKEYLVTAAEIEVIGDAYQNVGSAAAEEFVCRLETIFADSQADPFRPPRVTPKPEIRGVQTAIVTGKAGEEIYTDEYGRIKVLFPWDRYAKADETSSCWIRVARTIAGKGWGQVATPRIGQEVIVEFIDGDPDRPLVTGSVYNGDNPVPYELPKFSTISGTKTNSSKGGDGFNEYRFEDKKGEEQIFVNAEKNYDLRIGSDRFESVGNDRHLTVENDKNEHVKANRIETVDANHTEEIGSNLDLTVKGNDAKSVDGKLSLKVTGDVGHKFESNHSEDVSGDAYYRAANIVIEADTNITVKVGKSFIAISASGIKIGTMGDVVIDAKKNVTGNAGMNMSLSAKMQGKVEGKMMQEVSSSGVVKVQGMMVKIN